MLISVILTGILSNTNSHSFAINSKQLESSKFNTSKGSKEELYQDIFITLLMPYIDKSIDNYYGKYFIYLLGVDPWNVKILNIERPNGNRTSFFILRLEFVTYVGPHNSVGRDQVTIAVKYGSEPKVEKFEHIESYPLPPNYQNYVKKWPPN
jgi:hypothetical protein